MKNFFVTYKRIVSLALRVNSRLFIGVTILNSFWGLTNLPVLYINKVLIDVVISSIGKSNWQPLIRTVIIVIVIRTLIETVRIFISRYNYIYSDRLTRQVNNKVTVMIDEKINILDIPTLESPAFQDKYKRIETEAANRVWGMVGTISSFPNSLFTMISGAVPIFAFSPLIAILVTISNLPAVYVNALISKREYKVMEKQVVRYRIWDWIENHLTKAKHYYENRILNNTQVLVNKLIGVQKEVRDERHVQNLYRVKRRNLVDIPQNIISAGLNSYFFILAILAKITLGSAQLLYQSSLTLGNGFSMIMDGISSVYENYLYVSDLTWLLDLKPKNSDGTIIPQIPFTSGIEFRHVWFKYPSSPDWILQDVNFKIDPHENIAIVGENGAGKTTLIKLLVGFYQPDKGEVLVNGTNISNYDQVSYRKTLGVLFQDFSEYPFTARESIGFGDVDKIDDLSAIQEAATQTDIHEFIESLPKKYDNPLSKEFEGGIDPSKGQWQRIALARTLFRHAQIVILDEPTSNVDPKAEEEIFAKIIELTKNESLVLISHRFSTVRHADKILVLEKGTVVEEGSHEALIKKRGLYAKLFKLQAKSFDVTI
jgi:ABC-type multidrug transport system fused ATPase/permease subunit